MSLPISSPSGTDNVSRRAVTAGAAALAAFAFARPVRAETADMEQAIAKFLNGRAMQPDEGKVLLDIAPLVENGNSVSVTVAARHAMRAGDHVKRIALFNEKNPQPDVAIFHFTPQSAEARVMTRIRLATTQHVTAVAELSDGRCFATRREVIITIAACTEE